MQKTIREARDKQLSVTDLLAKFTNASQKPSMADIAAQNANSLTEEFFLTTSTYLEMVCYQQFAMMEHSCWLLRAC